MTQKSSSSNKALAVMLVFSLLQFCVVLALAEPGLSAAATIPQPQGITGRLTTRGNQNILVNGNNASNGATILSGATVETGDGVGATINLGRLGSIDIAPNTKALVEFSDGQIKVTLMQGCAIVRNKQGTYGQIYTDKGLAASNDENRKPASVLDVCNPLGAPAAIINQGAAANAGAGAGGGAVAVDTGVAEVSFGKVLAFGLPIIVGSTAAAVFIPCRRRGRNPSPGTPRGDCRRGF